MSKYRGGIRYRSIVSAWREDADGDCVEGYSAERVVCIEVDLCPLETQHQRARQMAQAAMQLLYPQCNAFEIYNTVDEKESPAEVLGFVTGWAKGQEVHETNPIVMFRTPNNPAEHREPGALTWEQVHAMDATEITCGRRVEVAGGSVSRAETASGHALPAQERTK